MEAKPLTPAQQLSADLADLKPYVLDPIWGPNANDVSDNLQLIVRNLNDCAAALSKWQGQGDHGSADDMETKMWIASTWAYFDLHAPNGVLTMLRKYRINMERASFDDASLTAAQLAGRRYRTVWMYCFISSLTIAYLKEAVSWTWVWRRREAQQYRAYQEALSAWDRHDAAYQAKHPLTALQANFPGLNLDPGYVPPDWNTWRNMPGCPVPILIQEVQEIAAYAGRIPPPADAQWDAMLQPGRRTAASVDFVVHPVAAGDTLNGLAQKFYQDPALVAQLFKLNSPPLTDANVLPDGAKLRIYAKDALPWAPLPRETDIQEA